MDEIVFWKDREQRIIDPTLFSKTAEEKAIALSNEASGNLNKITQLRKFYDEVLHLDMEAKARDAKKTEGEWNNILPLVHMLVAKAAYANGRKLVSDQFLKLVKSSVNQIKKPDDLTVFANFFEALMGFYRLYIEKQKKGGSR
jgi:CRISPR-associated protein Csm2